MLSLLKTFDSIAFAYDIFRIVEKNSEHEICRGYIAPTSAEVGIRSRRQDDLRAMSYGIGTKMGSDLIFKKDNSTGCFSGKARFFITSAEYRNQTWFEKLADQSSLHKPTLPLIASPSNSKAKSFIMAHGLNLFVNDGLYDFDKAQIFVNCLMGYFVYCGHHSVLEVMEIWNRQLDYLVIERNHQLLPIGTIPAIPSVETYISAIDAVEKKLPYGKIGDYRSFLHPRYAIEVIDLAETYISEGVDLHFATRGLNDSESLSERVLGDLLKKNEIAKADLSTDAMTLQREYGLAEAISTEHVSLDDTDMVVVLSGRSGFKGSYLEDANKYTLCPNEYDSSDTMRRMSYGISIAKKCAQNNRSNGINKPVYVYFNGVKRQNDELKSILEKEHSIDGYPASLFIIDSISLDNTLGQVIGLSKYLHTYWPLFCHNWGLSRAPNIVFCTSSYHVPRVILGVGSNSPLLISKFWLSHPEILRQLTPEMMDYVLHPGETLKKASIMVLGCDRHITANPFWEKDLFCDMQARVNYSSLHRTNNVNVQSVPSIASAPGENIVTLFNANVKRSLRWGLQMFDDRTTKILREDSATANHEKLQITLS